MFTLFNLLFAVIAMIMDHLFGLTYYVNGQNMSYGYIYTLYALAVLIPGLAVLARRMHDVGKSGWFALIGIIPVIGWIWILVLLFKDSVVGTNKYGSNPKGIGEEQFDFMKDTGK